MIGSLLEQSGWRQGSIVRPEDTSGLLELCGAETEETDLILIIASQSCDIAHHCLNSEPYIDACIARVTPSENGNLTHNKNPRLLQTKLSCRTGDMRIESEVFTLIKAHERVQIPRDAFQGLTPDDSRTLEPNHLDSLVNWLAARYTRPALPTEFNNRIASAASKLKRKAKKLDAELCGIYLEIMPFGDIPKEENYSVNLLALLPANFSGGTEEAEGNLAEYVELLSNAGMDVQSSLRKEDEVSVATLKRFRRLYYDDLSIRNNTPLPPEVENPN